MPSRGGRLVSVELLLSVLVLTVVAGGGWIAAGFGLQPSHSRILPIGALVLTVAAAAYIILVGRRMAANEHAMADAQETAIAQAVAEAQEAVKAQALAEAQEAVKAQASSDAQAAMVAKSAASASATARAQPAMDVPTSSAGNAASEADNPPFVDELTKLPSRFWFEHTLRSEIARSHRYKHPLSLVVVVVDQYRQVNHDHGQAMGDYVLIAVSRALRSNVRLSDHIARVRGDQFALMLTETDWTGAKIVGEKIRRAVELYPFDEDLAITVSVAVVTLTDSDSSESVVNRGERGILEARKRGGNRLVAVSLKNHA